MFKNVAAKFMVFAFDTTTNAPKTGDAANITAYVSKDYGAVTVLGDTTATEMDATNAPGYYLFDAAQAETNADCLMVSGKSSTANIKVLGAPAVIYTRPTTGWLAPATAGRTLVVDAAGLADANMVKMGPTGSGTAQTARDIGASVLLSSGTGTGQLKLASGYVAITWADVAAPTTAVDLSGTTIKTSQVVASVTGAVGSVTGAVGSVTGAVGSVTGNVGGNVVGSVASVTAGVTLTSGERTSVADALLNRDMSAVTVTNSRSPINALRTLRNKVDVPNGTVYAEDDTTAAWTFTTTTSAAADPITVVDPT